MIPEFVGRLPVIAPLHAPLGSRRSINILTEPKNALIKQYQALFAMEGATVEFSREALIAIARKAKERKTGARALRAIMEEVMLDAMFDLPSRVKLHKHFVVGEDAIMGTGPVVGVPGDAPAKETA